MGLLTLQDRRERGDLITLYEIVNGIEKIDKQDLLLMKEDEQMKGHSKIMKSCCLRYIKKYSFSMKL